MRNHFKIFSFYIVGVLFLSFGISLMILADLGAGPWDAFYVGLSTSFGFTMGSWVFMVGCLLILLNGYLLRKIPDASAVITIFLVGIFVDFWQLIVFSGFTPASTWMQVAFLSTGLGFAAAGISSYLQSQFARNPIDQLMMAVHFRTGFSLRMSKTLLEIFVLVLAFIVGGPIGIGTIIIALSLGPLIQIFYPRIEQLRLRWTAPAAQTS
ncbi:hypothetical protein B0H94_104130 [Salsuginibacillus halophilus]|uniref:Membrane protein YczE n=1 Tax=Salsuginibacillus halophilus TaxID=517424 RepID=A0A2P8HQP0_9BACI|nr:membrane protein [Salsuginibacillus halophilus]PSL48529.1 hypothetical protein B0H94_104130 [Salsuginibacillus halophilus]